MDKAKEAMIEAMKIKAIGTEFFSENKNISLTPKGNGMDVVLHWAGAGWYAPVQRENVVHEHYISGFDRDGFSESEDERVWDAAKEMSLSTPHWIENVEDYRGYVRA